MVFQVDQCKNFKDGKKCEKCGRMMPAYCKDQQDLEEKARKYDEWIASQTTSPEAEAVHEVEVSNNLSEINQVGEQSPATEEVVEDGAVSQTDEDGREAEDGPRVDIVSVADEHSEQPKAPQKTRRGRRK